MQSEPENFPVDNNPQAVPPPLPAGSPPSLLATSSPELAQPAARVSRAHQTCAVLLSVCLGLFLADGIVSLIDDSLILFLHVHGLTAIRGLVSLPALFAVIAVYVAMAFTPVIPRRLFLPVILFNPVVMLGIIPAMIYFPGWIQQMVWGISFLQVVVGLGVLHRARGGPGWRWPLVAKTALVAGDFRWRRLLGFVALNVVVLPPVVLVYLYVCATLAVGHLSDGFLALRRDGLVARARKYARDDGRTIQLFPMAHVGDASFYQQISRSFPSNSLVLMEGVTDQKHLLTNRITYKRVAKSLGLAEQQQEFRPSAQAVRADVDVAVFGTNTLDLLNLVMLAHTKGLNAQTLLALSQYSQPPDLHLELFDDLLGKRNRHLLGEIETRLAQSEKIVVPWGAAHMPGIAAGIQKLGFRVTETQEYVVIRFGSGGSKAGGTKFMLETGR